MNKCSNCKYSQHIDGDVRYWCIGQKNVTVVFPNDTCKDWKADRATNADKIRQMTDEELAREIAWLIVEAMKQLHPLAKWKASDEELIRGTADEMLDWLKQEVEE